MEVKEAVRIAKDYAKMVFEDEGMLDFGLEEVQYNVDDDTWNITVGFSRPWSSHRNAITALTGEPAKKRLYRVVHIEGGRPVSVMKRREDD